MSCPKIEQIVLSFCTGKGIRLASVWRLWEVLQIGLLLKLHKRDACATWFKRKVLNQGLEVYVKLLILSP